MPKVKICGLTNYEDALAAAKAGADYLGFVIECASPRSIFRETARDIGKQVKERFPHIKLVGVLEQLDLNELKEIIRACSFDVAQVSDELAENVCLALRTNAEVWKSIIVRRAVDVMRGESFRNVADKILYDAGKGSGKLFDHGLLAGISVNVIAGGISPDNVKGIIAIVKPEIIDVSSKIETKPGVKNHELIKKLFERLKPLSASLPL